VGNTRRRLSFFVMVLALSRQVFVEFTASQTMEHFLACHEHGFAALGVASKIMVDNLKSAVPQRLAGAAPVFNPRYLDFARHHGFGIEACNVARGNEKGRVESGAGYVKKNFLHGLELTDFGTIHAAAQVWLDAIANLHPLINPPWMSTTQALHTRLHFRGLLGLHSRYGPPSCSTAQGALVTRLD
jgi:transposase